MLNRTSRSIKFITLTATVLFIGLTYGQSNQFELNKREHLKIFKLAFEPSGWYQKSFFLRSQTWNKNKQFCLVSETNTPLSQYISSTIANIAKVYDKGYFLTKVKNIDDCPRDYYSVFIMLGGNPGFTEFQKIFYSLIESAPEKNYANFGKQIAFSVKLNKKLRSSFIFLDSTFGSRIGKHPHRDFRTSIWLEELFHALSGGRDVASTDISSILGENHDVTSYSDLYTKNPRGFCQVDFMILELILNGDKYTEQRSFKSYYHYFEHNYNQLNSIAIERRNALQHLADPRC